MDFTSETFAIQNNTERCTWAAFKLLVFLSSVIGDTLILVASFNKNAFKINNFIATIIQHIAVVDLSVSVFDVLPSFISLIANSWILGQEFCYIKVFVSYYVYATSMYMIALMTTSKFLLLRYPLRASSFSRNRGHQICMSVWIFCLSLPGVMLLLDKDDVHFYFRPYNCGYGHRNIIWKIALPILAFIFSLTPNILIISTTIPTLKYLAAARNSARRVHGSIPWQGALTVALTAIVFILSNLPFVAQGIAEEFMLSEDPSNWFHIELYRVTTSLLYINTLSNFYIYFFTIKSFRATIVSQFSSIFTLSCRIKGSMLDVTITR